jgi:hypothetical protein
MVTDGRPIHRRAGKGNHRSRAHRAIDLVAGTTRSIDMWWSSSLSSRAVAAALLCLLVAHGSNCAKHNNGGKSHKQGGRGGHAHAHAAPAPAPAPSPPPAAPPGVPPVYPTPTTTPPPASNGSSGGWLNAHATWYGAPNGAGPDDNGGACGFKDVNMPPFSAMTSCGNEPLFKDGKGCGSCYQVCNACM